MSDHHPACEANSGGSCNCMHPRVVVMRSASGDTVSFSDYEALESKLRSCEEDLSVARQSLYEVIEQRNSAVGRLDSITKLVTDYYNHAVGAGNLGETMYAIAALVGHFIKKRPVVRCGNANCK